MYFLFTATKDDQFSRFKLKILDISLTGIPADVAPSKSDAGPRPY